VASARSLTRRQLLKRLLVAGSAIALAPLAATGAPLARAQGGESIKVGVGELVQAGRADFAGGQAEGVELPRAGGPGGQTAGPAGGAVPTSVCTGGAMADRCDSSCGPAATVVAGRAGSRC
jgi:hypothetical protein